MGEQTLTLRKAWSVYDRWLADPRVEFYPEPRGVDAEFREATEPFAARPASKWLGDCWLLASANGINATLVTFDQALYVLYAAGTIGYAEALEHADSRTDLALQIRLQGPAPHESARGVVDGIDVPLSLQLGK